jgi:hypothetical protein
MIFEFNFRIILLNTKKRCTAAQKNGSVTCVRIRLLARKITCEIIWFDMIRIIKNMWLEHVHIVDDNLSPCRRCAPICIFIQACFVKREIEKR